MQKIIIITGASRGIGRASALRLSREHHKLFLACRQNTDLLKEVAALCGKNGAETCIFTGDLADPSLCTGLVHACTERFGTPDVLINNAGISHVALFQDTTAETLTDIINANLCSMVNLSREAAKGMLQNHSGRIINVSSVFGITGGSMEVEYSLTKGAVNAFTRALAKELAPSGIAVNAIAPGAIDTEMNHNLNREERTALEEEIPMGRFGTAEECAELIAFLADAPLYLTGEIIGITGGWNS